ncbi:MAG TPA: CsgG/HfaB family protein, partial [Planctomycetaceae bacterium]|nr:CsgG/HfaB family protein [Planctomycetaceae bacterium]
MRCSRLAVGRIAILFSLLTSSFAPAADDSPRPGADQRQPPPLAFRGWAVLATNELREIGLSDLLTANLSQHDFALVEREQLDAVLREIELSRLLSFDAAAQRLKVGQLVKADALVLLSLVENDKNKFVKLVISDCQYGSRLRLDHFPFAGNGQERRPLSPRAEAASDARGEGGSRPEPATLEQLVQDVAGAVDETRKRFAHGVERIVAVSPFLSKNLTH